MPGQKPRPARLFSSAAGLRIGRKRWPRCARLPGSGELLDAGRRIWRELPGGDWLEAFAAHPKIGGQGGKAAAWSAARASGHSRRGRTHHGGPCRLQPPIRDEVRLYIHRLCHRQSRGRNAGSGAAAFNQPLRKPKFKSPPRNKRRSCCCACRGLTPVSKITTHVPGYFMRPACRGRWCCAGKANRQRLLDSFGQRNDQWRRPHRRLCCPSRRRLWLASTGFALPPLPTILPGFAKLLSGGAGRFSGRGCRRALSRSVAG